LEMAEVRSCSGPPELRSLRSVGLGQMRDYLSGSRTDRSVMVGPRYDSMGSSFPCVLGICPSLVDQVPLKMWGLVLSRMSCLWELGVCLAACHLSRLGRCCARRLFPAFFFLWCYTFGLGARTFGTSDTNSAGLSRVFSDGSCPWLRHPPP
jgi:hypothetical protein